MASSSQASANSDSPPTDNGTSFTFVLNDLSQSSHKAPEKAQQQDRFAHTRTKRKRTSPADFAILEYEYEHEPRPDKKIRVEIASRVSLNEKEVQIWFQNRRQMTRRKARTWQPNEISEIIRSSQQSADSVSPPSSQADESAAVAEVEEKGDYPVNSKPAAGLFQVTSPSSFNQGHDPQAEQHDEVTQSTDSRDGPSTHAPESSQTSQAEIRDNQSRGGKKALKRTSSNIRLRMSLEGRAELVQDTNSPSPPAKTNRRESWTARGGLRRSQSAMSPPTPSLEQTSTDAPFSNQHRSMGRSRDARAWEFYCDKDAQDALSMAAEHDRKGSAQGALNLVRSNLGSSKSLGSPLMPSVRKQNPSVSIKHSERRKAQGKLPGPRSKLARASSSVARLQTVAPIYPKADGSDSDKENWQPGTRISTPAYPNAPTARPTLGLNTNGLSSAQVEDLDAVHSLLSLGGTW